MIEVASAEAETVLRNLRLQTPGGEVRGTLVVRDGRIAEIVEGPARGGVDGEGHMLLPGLIELHTDNLEGCVTPRPGIRWPFDSAAVYHDRAMISAGITTVCDAVALGDITRASPRVHAYETMIEAIARGVEQGRFAADHRLHLRCELTYDDLLHILERYVAHPLLSIVSVMDHTPGQRQFVDLDKFKQYYIGKHGVRAHEIDALIAHRRRNQEQFAATHRRRVAELAREHGIALATHDDATLEHVREAVADGAVVAEFPTTVEAARAAHEAGLLTLMGSPNLVLGGSHSGNVAAIELARAGIVDVFSSDYVPQSLLEGVFVAARELGIPVHVAMRTVTVNAARAIGLDGDRGSLAVGLRADLVAVDTSGPVPRVAAVYRDGRRVA